jgi:hypothetical protein
MSIGQYGLENIPASKSFIRRAKNIDPYLRQAQNSWELQYVSEKEPNIFFWNGLRSLM